MQSFQMIIVFLCLSFSGVSWASETKFDFNGYSYPILYENEGIRFNGYIDGISYFTPLFGKDRIVVNPAKPHVSDGEYIHFSVPGEYYIRVNGTANLKILVLSKHEPLSQSVTRLFDFMSANLLYSNNIEEKKLFTHDTKKYIDNWFNSDVPGRLFCGPTHRLFRTIIADRLKLPTRIVTFPGVWRWNGKVHKSSHNVTEIYIPDKKKWVLYDINNGFFVKWMDAIELAAFFHHNSSGDSGMTVANKMLSLDVHVGGPTIFWPINNKSVIKSEFSTSEVSNLPTAYFWKDTFRFYYSGAAY